MANSTQEELIDFVHEQTGVAPVKLRPQTRLAEDLKLDGDDAEEFMLKFAETFNVDLQDFKFENHFNMEGFDTVGCSVLIQSLFWKQKSLIKLMPIILTDLEDAANRGKWVND